MLLMPFWLVVNWLFGLCLAGGSLASLIACLVGGWLVSWLVGGWLISCLLGWLIGVKLVVGYLSG